MHASGEILEPPMASSPERAVRFAGMACIGHALILVGLFLFLLVEIPNYETVFLSCGPEVSPVTRLILAASRVLWSHLALSIIVGVLFLCVDLAILYGVRKSVAKVWSHFLGWCVTVVLLVTIGLVFMSINMTLAAILDYTH